MDNFGSEELSKLSLPTTSSNSNCTTQKNITKNSVNILSPIAATSTSDTVVHSTKNKNINKNIVNSNKDDSDNDSFENDGKEKTDATPENLKKIDDVITSSTATVNTSSGNNIKLGNYSKATKDMSENNNKFFNFDNAKHHEIRSSAEIPKSELELKAGEKKKSIQNESYIYDDIEKTGVEELKIIELDDITNTNTTLNSSLDDDDSPSKQEFSSLVSSNSFAFTIDFGNGPNTNNPNSEAKYKSLMERFQNRHKRGASMSKLELTNLNSGEKESNNQSSSIQNSGSINVSSKPTRVMSAHPNNVSSSRQSRLADSTTSTEAAKVKLRIRERSTSGVRDSSKRHSWSPRSSTVEPNTENHNVAQSKAPLKTNRLVTKSSLAQQEDNFQKPQNSARKPVKTFSNSSTSNYSQKNSARTSEFTPRSTAMQRAFEKIDFLCSQPPLDDFNPKQHRPYDDSDEISEAGTYTLDGDNYTEEQKEIMNIDKSKLGKSRNSHKINYDLNKLNMLQRPTDLPISNNLSTFTSVTQENRRGNVLEIDYYHEQSKPKISYLEKFKSRMKSKKSPEKSTSTGNKASAPNTSPSDMGTFTSVTASGVLAKKSSLDSKPRITRKNSLTTSQIDSSEYVSTSSAGGDSIKAPISQSYTDHQKAEYRLNIFTNQSDSQILNDMEAATTPDSPQSGVTKLSDTAVLKTAQTKSDWIQEWARNARARSVSSTIKPTDHHPKLSNTSNNAVMSRSYNCDFGEENNSVFSDSGDKGTAVIYRNKPIERFKSHAIGDYEYSSDPNVSRRSAGSPNLDLNLTNNRPPVSPSKIPSPMHSIGRARSISKTRSSLQDLSPAAQSGGEPDFYLQKTAAVISTLTQNLSRKNSLKSINSANSPRRYGNYSADEYSPPGRHINQNNINIIGMHRRNLSLDCRNQQNFNENFNNYMSQSYSNEINNFSDLNNDYRIPRPRKNSFDSTSYRQQYQNHIIGSPVRNVGQQQRNKIIDQTYSIKQRNNQNQSQQQQQQMLSPLRRSSSFSAKPLSNNNIGRITTNFASVQKSINPGVTSRYGGGGQINQKNPLQKSASSNSFRKMYSDYDDNVAYYINDEDDLDYCSSEDFEEPYEQMTTSAIEQQTEPPLTNTRYNKALLMRIERSKQKVAGTATNNSNNSGFTTKPAPGGVMACPNTPELPRRAVQSAQRASMRQSVPRDSSLNRLKGDVPNSLASAKKQILQTAKTNTQPRYLDISKYKPSQGASFLKKDESKVTLQKTEIKKSPSSTNFNLNRADPSRTSNRSVKSGAGNVSSSSNNRPGSGSNRNARDNSVTKQKEAELEMWRRRAKYDPMRAAAEDRRKKEEAKKLIAQTKTNESSAFLRSQSYHCGVVGLANSQHNNINDDSNNRWTTESSDEDGAYISSSTTTTN